MLLLPKPMKRLPGLELHKENIRRISEEAETSVKGVDAVMVEKANNLRQTAEQACAKLTETGRGYAEICNRHYGSFFNC